MTKDIVSAMNLYFTFSPLKEAFAAAHYLRRSVSPLAWEKELRYFDYVFW